MPQTNTKAWHTMSEALAYLARNGFNVSEQSVISHIKRGSIKAQEVGKREEVDYMFHVSELDRFLKETAAKE